MAHGYLGDGYGTHGEFDPDREDDRERAWRDRERRMMFSSDEGLRSDRASRREAFGQFGGRSEGRQRFSANRDDHYRSWRDRHMSELDRDYADFCREREQQFHRDFDDWRSQRHANAEPLQTGMTQTGFSHEPTGELELTNSATAGKADSDPMAEATLGTTSSRRRR